MKEDKTEYNILLVSDIHNQKDQLEKIVSKCKSVNYSPDYIISTETMLLFHKEEKAIRK